MRILTRSPGFTDQLRALEDPPATPALLDPTVNEEFDTPTVRKRMITVNLKDQEAATREASPELK
jgi:hypothetical protein